MRRPKPSLTPFYLRYAVALAAPLLGWAVRQAFTPVWGPAAVPFIFAYPAVAVACWYGRMLPGIVAIAASITLATWTFVEPLDSLALSLGAALQLVSFAAMSMVIVAAIEAMHRAKDLALLTGRQLSVLLESIGECFYMLDAGGRFTYVNAQMERHVGRPRSAMLGRVAWEIFPEVLGSELDRQLRVAMAEGRPVQFQVLSPVSRRWLEIRAYPSTEGLSVFYRDVTERQEAEEELRKAKDALAVLNQQLEEKVLERTAKLRESVADLEQFSYSISHDFRSPLRSMQAFSALLLEEYQEKLAPTAVNYLLRLDSSAKRMLKLLDAVLSYTGAVRSEINLTRVDLDHLVREILEQYPNLHPDAVDIEIVNPLLPVRASVAQLTQCLSNVLGNAVKFVAPGVRPSVRIWTEKRDGWVRVCVRDNGIGIDARIMDRLWGMFERGVSRDEYEGTGIGLSVVKRAVERMGGTVGVESESGKGSTFWFQLLDVASE